jgi:hypothetical protein
MNISQQNQDARLDNDVMELQIIKARTMFQMLDEFSVSGVQKQLLYLTNAQAREFNNGNIDRLLATFEIPAAHIVITFPKSSCGFAQWNIASVWRDVSQNLFIRRPHARRASVHAACALYEGRRHSDGCGKPGPGAAGAQRHVRHVERIHAGNHADA